jgi:transaldolase
MPKIFYDGCDMKYASYPSIVGFTTNTTIMRQAKQFSYRSFYEQHKDVIGDRPISFQCFSDDPNVIADQARRIHSLGQNIYVKIPVISSTGNSLLPTIVSLLREGIKVNITAVFTKDQIVSIASVLDQSSTPCIVSIFCGRISDTGVDPKEIMLYGVQMLSSFSNVELLWAGCKDNLVIQNADQVGCHIVTLPDAIVSRISRIGQKLDDLSQDTVASFLKDALEGNLSIE